MGISWSKVPDPHGHTAQVESAKAWGVDYRRLGCSMVGSPSVQVLSSLLLVYQSSVIKYHVFFLWSMIMIYILMEQITMYIKYHLVSLFYKHLRHTYNHIIYQYMFMYVYICLYMFIYVYICLSMYANCRYFFPGPPAWRCRCHGVPWTVPLVDEQLSHQKDGEKRCKKRMGSRNRSNTSISFYTV